MGRAYQEEAAADEVEAVRTVSGEPPGLVTPLRRKRSNPVGNDRHKTLSVMEEHCAFFRAMFSK